MKTFTNLKPYRNLLTPEVHLDLIKAGMVMAIKQKYGVNYAGITKLAEGAVGDLVKLVLAATVLAGVPTGIALHKLDLAAKPGRAEEKELQEKIKFYKSLTSNVESSLAEQGGPNARPVPEINV